MKWIDQQIKKWQDWSVLQHNRVSMIPPHIQVGKVLETHPSIDDAIRFVAMNATVDQESVVFNDSYWFKVHNILLSYKIRCILEGADEDNRD